MKQPMISIIVPVYNAEKYIEECLYSVLNQDFADYEVIVVNDGSTDGSPEICNVLANKDSRIRVFSIENHGVSFARNYGIEKAEGHWLMFLDSDDYLIDGSLSLLAGCISDDVQEICGNYTNNRFQPKRMGREIVQPENVIEMILDPANEQKLPSFYEIDSASLLGVWGKLFRREIVEAEKIRFDEKLKLSEDMLFHIHYLKNIENVLLLNDSIFYYRENPESVTKKFKVEYVRNRFYLFEQLEECRIRDAVFVTSTMFLLNCQVEENTTGLQRKALEKTIKAFWKKNRDLLLETKGRKISVGKWQNMIYKICVELFLMRLYQPAFLFLRLYEKIR